MEHKILENIGVKPYFLEDDSKDERKEKWQEQRKLFSFDERETWELDYAFCCWCYERVKLFLEASQRMIDLTYHKFTYEGKEYNQLELLELLLAKLEQYFYRVEEGLDEFSLLKEIGAIWAIVLPAMWW